MNMDLLNPGATSVPEPRRLKMMTSDWWIYNKEMDEKARWTTSMMRALKTHWPEYLMEAAALGIFMMSACGFGVLLFHPGSPVAQNIGSEMLRQMIMGIAMGTTLVGIVFSPFGKRSGAHMNPAVTLTFFRLGKIEGWDGVFYTLFQFCGGILGVVLAMLALGNLLANKSVNYVVTVPGTYGPGVAFLAELTISFVLMTVILTVSNTRRLARWTGFFAGFLVATYITIENPLSGMSMNPARTFGSAAVAQVWTALWIYFTAPPLGMLAAGELYKGVKASHVVACAKLHHYNNKRCIFRCEFKP